MSGGSCNPREAGGVYVPSFAGFGYEVACIRADAAAIACLSQPWIRVSLSSSVSAAMDAASADTLVAIGNGCH